MNEEIYRRWEEAYRANPGVYEKKDGTLIVGFALTEDTDSIFSICPENGLPQTQKGKPLANGLITMVSLTTQQGGIIGQMKYHEAVKRLEPFFIARADNWALIRAMSHDELNGLFENSSRTL